MTDFTIGAAARTAGCKVQTIRYYEQIGILRSPPRTEGNQRIYGQEAVERLTFIRHARELGFPLEAIRDLLSLSDNPEQSCSDADSIAQEQLKSVERRLLRLQRLKIELKRMIKECRGGRVANCRVIEVLGNHALCASDDHAAI